MTDLKLIMCLLVLVQMAVLKILRAAAEIAQGYKVDPKCYSYCSSGSGRVKIQAEKEGLDKIFTEAGFEWRDAGC